METPMLNQNPPSQPASQPPTTETWGLSLQDITGELSGLGRFKLDGYLHLTHTIGPTPEPPAIDPPSEDLCGIHHIHTSESASSSPEEVVALSMEHTVGELMLRLRATFRVNRIRFLSLARQAMLGQALPEVREDRPDLSPTACAERQELALCLWVLRTLARQQQLRLARALVDQALPRLAPQ
jgi:hypothetical protein